MRKGERIRNKPAGKHARKMSSNCRVKSKDRQLLSTRGPKDRSLSVGQCNIAAKQMKLSHITPESVSGSSDERVFLIAIATVRKRYRCGG